MATGVLVNQTEQANRRDTQVEFLLSQQTILAFGGTETRVSISGIKHSHPGDQAAISTQNRSYPQFQRVQVSSRELYAPFRLGRQGKTDHQPYAAPSLFQLIDQ